MTRPLTKSSTVYRLVLEATDGGGLKSLQNAEISLSVIDTRQQPPIFERARYQYAVREDVPTGTPVGGVRATSRQRGESESESESVEELRVKTAIVTVDGVERFCAVYNMHCCWIL